jgi:hypothetical protein
MSAPEPGCQFAGTWPDRGAWLGAAACTAFVVPDAPLLELELPIAKPPIATATTATPAATNLVSLRENMETTPVVRMNRVSPVALWHP